MIPAYLVPSPDTLQVPWGWFQLLLSTTFLLHLLTMNIMLGGADPTLLPRFLHSVLASVAVAGLALGLYYDWQKRHGNHAAAAHIPLAMNWFAYATIGNFGVGT